MGILIVCEQGPSVVPGKFAHLARYRVVENIGNASHLLFLGLLGRFSIGFFQQLPGSVVSLVVVQREKRVQPSQEMGQLGRGNSVDHKMDMVEHQTKSNYFDSHFPGQGAEQGVKHQTIIHLVEKAPAINAFDVNVISFHSLIIFVRRQDRDYYPCTEKVNDYFSRPSFPA